MYAMGVGERLVGPNVRSPAERGSGWRNRGGMDLTIANIIGDLLIVFVFKGGMFGLGLTTAISNLIYWLLLSLHFLRKGRILRYRLRGIIANLKYIRGILVNGIPSGTTRIASAAAGILINHMLATAAGSEMIAAYSVQKSVGSLLNATYLGVADTVWVLSSVYFGEEDKRALDSLQKTAWDTGMLIILCLAVLLILFPGPLTRVYMGNADAAALVLGRESVRFFALCMPFYLFVYAFDDYLIGTRHLRAANWYGLLLECGFLVPVVWLMIQLRGGIGVWFGTLLSLVLMTFTAIIMIARHKQGKDLNTKRLLLPAGFGTDVGKELSISADSEMEVMGMSRLAGLFCEENGISKKRASILALCVEEMAMNIIGHGFTDGKPHEIDIRFLIKEDELILRIRDDCRPFNPVERYQMSQPDPEDPMKNAGIRLVMKMCKSMQYYSISSTNNLIIRI